LGIGYEKDGFLLLTMPFTSEKINRLNDCLQSAGQIVITAHKSPDGDSVGSSLALYHYLIQEHDNVIICHPDKAPDFLHWMKGYDQIQTWEENREEVTRAMNDADVIFCLDYNAPGRIGQMDPLLGRAKATKVMIDHHRDPVSEFVDIMFSDPAICSTAQLIFELINARSDLFKLNDAISEAIYTGLITDTGSFRFSSVTPRTHEIAAYLIDKGLHHSRVHELIFDNNTENRIRLTSYAMLEKLVVKDEYKTAYVSLTLDEQARFSAKKGDTEGLVNKALALQGVQMAVFFKEADGLIKISFRSSGTIPVNDIARNHFGGGGHKNASGGKHVGSITEAIEKFVTILPKFVEENKVHFTA
jgi:bifunctional oligoribonuclease and PAP phosphatase NrnA